MKLKTGTVIVFAVIQSILSVHAQNNPHILLRKVCDKLQKAVDYSVDASIKVDIPFIRILPVNVKIFYKQPDKFRVESKSITIVPRQGFDNVTKMLADTNSFIAMNQGDEKMGTVLTSIVNIIPISDTGDLILGKLWIDPAESVIIKSQLTTKSSGTIVTEYTYGALVSYGLPDKITFTVDVKKFKIPKEVPHDQENSDAKNVSDNKKEKKGKIYILLSDYKVNKGIPERVFKK